MFLLLFLCRLSVCHICAVCCVLTCRGATIKCAHRTCPRWFHWPCVRLQGLAGSVEFNVPEQLLACAEHSRWWVGAGV
jgi:hypothetical protein